MAAKEWTDNKVFQFRNNPSTVLGRKLLPMGKNILGK